MLLEPDEPPKNLGWSAFEGTKRVGDGDDSLTDGELVWPVAEYTHDEGCSVTGGYVYQGAKLPRLAGRYLYGDFCSGVLWSLERAPWGAPPTSGASAPACRSSPTSVPTPTASRCSRPRPARSTARSVRNGRDGPVDPDPHVVAGMPGREAEPAAAQAQAARQLQLQQLVVAVERARDDDRLGVRLAPGPRPIATDSGRITTWTSPASSAAAPKRPSSHSTTPSRAVPGSTSASPRNSASQRLRGPLVDLLRRARPARSRPLRMTATVPASDSASAWSCVTSSALVPARAQDRRHLRAQRLAQAGVERRERLVEQHDLGVGGERARERDALALAARQLVRVGAGAVGEADELEALVDALAAPRRRSRRCRPPSGAGTARRPGRPCRSGGARARPRRRRRSRAGPRSRRGRRRAARSRR